jgi:hypothetical protein
VCDRHNYLDPGLGVIDATDPGRWREASNTSTSSSSGSDFELLPSSSSSSSSTVAEHDNHLDEAVEDACPPDPAPAPAPTRYSPSSADEVNTCLANLDHEATEFELAAGKLSEQWQSYYGNVVWCRTHKCFPW